YSIAKIEGQVSAEDQRLSDARAVVKVERSKIKCLSRNDVGEVVSVKVDLTVRENILGSGKVAPSKAVIRREGIDSRRGVVEKERTAIREQEVACQDGVGERSRHRSRIAAAGSSGARETGQNQAADNSGQEFHADL